MEQPETEERLAAALMVVRAAEDVSMMAHAIYVQRWDAAVVAVLLEEHQRRNLLLTDALVEYDRVDARYRR